MLQKTFLELVSNYTDNQNLKIKFWNEIEKQYTLKKRFYHTLNHLENLLIQLTEVKSEIKNWDCILFTLYYHDFIYNALKSDNEEQSASFAEKILLQIDVDFVELCKNQILATKKHLFSTNSDTNYFTDADLSILGQDWETYSTYAKNVRKEYAIYPDFIYNPGRKKALNHFLSMEKIFKTDYFASKYENQAKINLVKELKLL